MKKFYLSFGTQYTREPHPALWNVPNLPERLLEVEFEDELSLRKWAQTGPLQNKYAFIYAEEDRQQFPRWFPLGTFTYDFQQGRMVGDELSPQVMPLVMLEWSPNDDSPPCVDFTCVCGHWRHLCDGPEWITVGIGQAPGVECPECGVAWSLYRVRLTEKL